MLTQEQLTELKNLINNFKNQLKSVDDTVDTEIIYKSAIVSFEELGLLPDYMSIEYAQRLVIGKEENLLINKALERWYNRKQDVLDENENFFCLISGSTINTIFAGSVPLSILLHCILFSSRQIVFLYFLKENHYNLWRWWADNFGSFAYYLLIFRWGLWLCASAGINLFPIKLGAFILYGNIRAGDLAYFYTIPAEGWVDTIGPSGNKSWEGSFYGYATGFTGIKIIKGGFNFFYLGATYKVHIEYN